MARLVDRPTIRAHGGKPAPSEQRKRRANDERLDPASIHEPDVVGAEGRSKPARRCRALLGLWLASVRPSLPRRLADTGGGARGPAGVCLSRSDAGPVRLQDYKRSRQLLSVVLNGYQNLRRQGRPGARRKADQNDPARFAGACVDQLSKVLVLGE